MYAKKRALPALCSGGAAVHRLGHFCVTTSPNTAALRTVGASPSSLGRWVLRAQLTPSCKQEPPQSKRGWRLEAQGATATFSAHACRLSVPSLES